MNIQLGIAVVAVQGAETSAKLREFQLKHADYETSAEANLRLIAKDGGVHLNWVQEVGKPLEYYIDVEKVVRKLRSYPAPKQGAFNQSLGKKSKKIIDATGGWGGDALIMCSQGYEVVILERNPIMALMLSEAMQRLSRTEWAIDNSVRCPEVMCCDAIDYLSNLNAAVSETVDCIYLDPMFPAKKKKSAAVNKQMQLLKWLVGADLDSEDLLLSAMKSGVKRLSVKRPDFAAPLIRIPDVKFSSKLVHYDVYLNAENNRA